MPLYFHSSSGRTASSKMKKLGVKMRPEMLLHTKQTRPELHAASPLKAELHILRSEKSTGAICVKTRYKLDLAHFFSIFCTGPGGRPRTVGHDH